MANGLDVNKFVDYAKLVSEGKLDGETIQLWLIEDYIAIEIICLMDVCARKDWIMNDKLLLLQILKTPYEFFPDQPEVYAL